MTSGDEEYTDRVVHAALLAATGGSDADRVAEVAQQSRTEPEADAPGTPEPRGRRSAT